MSDDDLAALLYLATSHPDEFIRCACAARSCELRGLPVTEAAVARQAKVDDRALAADIADWLTEARPLRYRNRRRQLGHDATLTLKTYGHVIDELDDQPAISAEDAIRAARAKGPRRASG